MGKSVNDATVLVEYKPQGVGPAEMFGQVANAVSCAADELGAARGSQKTIYATLSALSRSRAVWMTYFLSYCGLSRLANTRPRSCKLCWTN